MTKNVEKLDEIEVSLTSARDELEVWLKTDFKLTDYSLASLSSLFFYTLQELNKEEELLEWEASQFPVLQEMIAYKEPYDKLWRTAFNFHNKHEHWLNGTYSPPPHPLPLSTITYQY